MLSNVRGGLGAEHIWPTSAGNAGVHKPGSAVAFYGTGSQVSSSDTDGRLMLTSDRSQLWAVNSGTTFLVGGRYATYAPTAYLIPLGSVITSGVTMRWLIEPGSGMMVEGSSTTAVTFRTTFVQSPVLVVTGHTSATSYTPVAGGASTTGVTVRNLRYSTETYFAVPTGEGYAFSYIAAGYVAANS
jgi:hypothetical protein